jgi:hypothetical protein
MDPMKLIRAAHSASFLGVGEAPYVDLGAGDAPPYDMNAPGVIGEVKAVLVDLAQKLTAGVSPADTRWQSIRDDQDGVPTWDEATADELVLMLGRIRNLQWLATAGIEEPWWSIAPVGPIPTATGLEMLAGATSYFAGPPMPRYLAWRSGTIAPPSRVSGPSASAPVVPPSYYGPFLYAPAGMPEPYASSLATIEAAMLADWGSAATASDETARSVIAGNMLIHRAARDAIISQALSLIPPREGVTTVAHVDAEACAKVGGTYDEASGRCNVKSIASWLWLLSIPVGIGAVYYATRPSKARRPR